MRRPHKHSSSSSKHDLSHNNTKIDFLHALPDDLVIFILSMLISSASSPHHFISPLLTCKRLNKLGFDRLVLSKANVKIFSVNAKRWSEHAHKFFHRCVVAGNVHASYTLGMIRFYCLQNRESGFKLIADAATKCHVAALYSLAVIQFNGSGRSKIDKDLKAGVALCAKASLLGHINALRELGHCLQDGYGVKRNISEGRRLLIQANARELTRALRATAKSKLKSPEKISCDVSWRGERRVGEGAWRLFIMSDYGYYLAVPEVHPANRFMKEWFDGGFGVLAEDLMLCGHDGCGRPETRAHEFRRCSVCGKVNYCSRGCQALDWKLRHKMECSPVEGWVVENDGVGFGVV